MKTLLFAAAALIAVGAAAPAFAGEKGKARFDANGDGAMSMQERQSKKMTRLMRLDRDGDARISHAEYSVMSQRAAQKGRGGGKDKFAKLDLNRDGFVTQDEIADRLARKFARAGNGAGVAPAYGAAAGRGYGGQPGYDQGAGTAPGYYAPEQAPMDDGSPQ